MTFLKTQLQKNDLWKRPLRNAGILLLGRGTQAIFSLVYLALAARALGPENFGYLVLIHSLALTAARLIRFQSWQAILSYGAEAIEEKNIPRFHKLLTFCFGIDLMSSVIGFIVLQSAMVWIATFLQLPDSLVEFSRFYMIGVLFLVMGSVSEGVMRLFDRHDLISIQSVIEPTIRFAGAIYLFVYGGDLKDFLIVWFIAMIAAKIVGMGLSYIMLYQKKILDGFKLELKSFLGPEKGIWRFVAGTSLTASLNINNHQFAVLLCGWLLGPAGAGLYRVGQQISNVLSKPATKLLIPAIYTDMALFNAEGSKEKTKDVTIQTIILAFGAAVTLCGLLILFGKPIITAFVGAEYIEAYPVMVLLCIAALIGILSFPLEPLLISAQKVKQTVFANLIGVLIYFASFYILAAQHGLTGAGVAMILYTSVLSCLLWLFTLQHLKNKPQTNDIKDT